MLGLIMFLVLLGAGYGFGSYAEKNHLKKIIQKEKELQEIVILSKYDAKTLDLEGAELFTGNIVLSIDYFKKFIAGFINIFGGRVTVYNSILDRARRDAIVKVKQQAKEKGFNAIANLRLETSSISKGAKNQIGSIEVLAYATGVNLKKV